MKKTMRIGLWVVLMGAAITAITVGSIRSSSASGVGGGASRLTPASKLPPVSAKPHATERAIPKLDPDVPEPPSAPQDGFGSGATASQ
jgi:hypothetical protein